MKDIRMNKSLLILLLLALPHTVSATNIDLEMQDIQTYETIQYPASLGNIEVYLEEGGIYHVVQDGIDHEVQNCFVDPLIRKATDVKLDAFIKNGGYLIVNQFAQGEFHIKAKMRLLGSGPFWGGVAYWATKIVVYGVAVAAVTAVTFTTAGTLTGPSIGLVSAAGIGSGVGTAVVGGGAIASGGLAASAAAASVALGTAGCVSTTAVVVAGAGSAFSAAAFAESCAATVGVAVLLTPTP